MDTVRELSETQAKPQTANDKFMDNVISIFGKSALKHIINPSEQVESSTIIIGDEIQMPYGFVSCEQDVVVFKNELLSAVTREEKTKRILGIFPSRSIQLTNLWMLASDLKISVSSGKYMGNGENPKDTYVLIDIGLATHTGSYASITPSLKAMLRAIHQTPTIKGVVFFDSTGKNNIIKEVGAMRTQLGPKVQVCSDSRSGFIIFKDIAGIR